MSRLRLLLGLLALGSVGCGVDNTGGEPPPGTDVAIELPAGLDDLAPCFGGEDAAALLDDEAAVDAWLSACDGTDTSALRDALVAAIDALGDEQRLVGVGGPRRLRPAVELPGDLPGRRRAQRLDPPPREVDRGNVGGPMAVEAPWQQTPQATGLLVMAAIDVELEARRAFARAAGA